MTVQRDVMDERISLAEDHVYTVPPQVRQIEVVSGGAWVSLGLDNVVVGHREVVQIHPGRQQVLVTPVGRARLEFEMRA